LTTPLHKPYLTGREQRVLEELFTGNQFSGNGIYSKKCQAFLEKKYGFGKCLLTHSCTGALELISLLIDLKPGDEVIVPGYTFVSTANAFLLRGAKVVFADSLPNHPNIDPESVASLINPNTRAVVCVHYAGYPCDLTALRSLCDQHKLLLVEDAAQAIGAYHVAPEGQKIAAGSVGDFAAFSFHDTKNIHCGEGGACIINNKQYSDRAEILWEKGTNRSAFLRGEVERYEWKAIGSSFLLSEIHAALLWEQLQDLEKVNLERIKLCHTYAEELESAQQFLHFPTIQQTGNGHLFFVICQSQIQRDELKNYLHKRGIQSAEHYQNLNNSPFGLPGSNLPNVNEFAERLLRLPIYNGLKMQTVSNICENICTFFEKS
jgi:dTDP-4-amino-4,6-dideoxygalactose transaminase